MSVTVGARAQGLPANDRALVLGRVAEGRNESGRFTPADLSRVYKDLALPPPSKASNALAALKKVGLATPVGSGEWRLTPKGRQRCGELLGELDLAALDAESATGGGAFLGNALNTTLPPWLASAAILPSLRRFLDGHPFETNVFGMTRFPDEEDGSTSVDPVREAIDVTREACRLHGLELHLASDRAIDDDLWTNVAAHMWASQYGVAFFEDRAGTGINYNMTIEVGGMLMTGRRCALLKDRSIARMPTDLVGRIYKPVDFDSRGAIATALHDWLANDLRLGKCNACPR